MISLGIFRGLHERSLYIPSNPVLIKATCFFVISRSPVQVRSAAPNPKYINEQIKIRHDGVGKAQTSSPSAAGGLTIAVTKASKFRKRRSNLLTIFNMEEPAFLPALRIKKGNAHAKCYVVEK